MTDDFNTLRAGTGGRVRGPHPGLTALAFTTLFLASLVPVTLLFSETHFPAPYQPADEVVAYFRAEGPKVRACAFLQFLAASALGVLTAALTSRLRADGAGGAIALFGGLAGSFFMAASALVQWTLGQPGIADDAGLTRALYFLLFATGGVGYTVPLGLLTAGLSASAASARLWPRWLTASGLALGGVGLLSSLTLVVPGALPLIPLTRFPGFAWLVAAGFYPRAHSPTRTEPTDET